jgi:hypothetical protein
MSQAAMRLQNAEELGFKRRQFAPSFTSGMLEALLESCTPPGPRPEHVLRPRGMLHQDDRSLSRERSDGNEPPEAAKFAKVN